MPPRRRALVASLLLPLLLFVALASGCLVWYVADDPYSGDAITADGGSGDAGSGDSGACLPSEKLCVGTCSRQDDPSVGCSGDCTACDTPPNAAPKCVLRGSKEECALGDCNAPFADCDRDASDGCEAQLTTTENCGTCGVACPMLAPYCIPKQDGGDGYVCSSTCPQPPLLPCGMPTECIDPLRDAKNCASCGHDCTANNGNGFCDAGVCDLICAPGYCKSGNGRKCVLPGDSSPNCGACGKSCTGLQECCTKGGVSSCKVPFSGPSDAAAPPGGNETCKP